MHTIDTNIYIKGSTQYAGVPFTGYANFGSRKIGVNSTGLFEVCCGDTDDGEDIESYFGVIKTDFGVKSRKRLRYVYVLFKSDSDMFLEVSADDGLAKQYTIKANREGQQYTRVTVDRGQKGAYWYFRLRNMHGNDFAIDGLKAQVIILPEGYK